MSTDKFFNEAAVVELPIDEEIDYGYKAHYYVNVTVDSEDDKVVENLRNRFRWMAEQLFFMEQEKDKDMCYRYSIHDTSKTGTGRRYRRFLGSILSLVEYGVKRGATMFLRIYEGMPSDEGTDKERRPLFRNVASTNVGIISKQLMSAFKSMGEKQDICVWVEIV